MKQMCPQFHVELKSFHYAIMTSADGDCTCNAVLNLKKHAAITLLTRTVVIILDLQGVLSL